MSGITDACRIESTINTVVLIVVFDIIAKRVFHSRKVPFYRRIHWGLETVFCVISIYIPVFLKHPKTIVNISIDWIHNRIVIYFRIITDDVVFFPFP